MKILKKAFLLLIFSAVMFSMSVPATSAKYAKEIEIGTIQVTVVNS